MSFDNTGLPQSEYNIPKMTEEEAMILLQKSHFDDCANSVCGLLRSLSDRIPPHIEDEVQGNLQTHLRTLANRLRENNERSTREIIEYIGRDRRCELAELQIRYHTSPYEVLKDRLK